jgi:hypothetical protein
LLQRLTFKSAFLLAAISNADERIATHRDGGRKKSWYLKEKDDLINRHVIH